MTELVIYYEVLSQQGRGYAVLSLTMFGNLSRYKYYRGIKRLIDADIIRRIGKGRYALADSDVNYIMYEGLKIFYDG